jgi:hypothetical protein
LRRRSGSGAFRHSRTSIPESTTARPGDDRHEDPLLAEVRPRPPSRQPDGRRKGRIYIINKTQKRYKARQG